MKIRCFICKRELNSANNETWCYIEHWPGNGYACLHHHGVEKEFQSEKEKSNE